MEPVPDREEGRAGVSPAEKEAETAETLSFVIFRLGAEWFALPTQVVREVTDVRAIHSVPQRSASVLLGLVNLRGELQLCVSLNALLGLDSEDVQSRTTDHRRVKRLVVVEKEGDRWVFPVAEVREVFHCTPDDVQETPTALAPTTAPYVRGVIRWMEKQVGQLDEILLFDTLKRRIS